MKDELNGLILKEYVGLRPKMYALKYDGEVKNNKSPIAELPKNFAAREPKRTS